MNTSVLCGRGKFLMNTCLIYGVIFGVPLLFWTSWSFGSMSKGLSRSWDAPRTGVMTLYFIQYLHDIEAKHADPITMATLAGPRRSRSFSFRVLQGQFAIDSDSWKAVFKHWDVFGSIRSKGCRRSEWGLVLIVGSIGLVDGGLIFIFKSNFKSKGIRKYLIETSNLKFYCLKFFSNVIINMKEFKGEIMWEIKHYRGTFYRHDNLVCRHLNLNFIFIMGFIRYNSGLDKKVIDALGRVSFNLENIYIIEKYGIQISDYWLYIFWNYWMVTIYVSVNYITLREIGTAFMISGKPFELRKLMAIWNFLVASISLCEAIRVNAVIYETWKKKLAMIITSIPTGFGSIMMFFSYTIWPLPLLIIGRFVIGIACGIYTCLAPLYLTEISPLQVKGATGIINQFAIVIGVLVSQVLGLDFILGTSTRWSYLLGFSLIPCILHLSILVLCPDSPRYLLITRHNVDEARKALIFLRGTDDIEHEISEMSQEKESNDTASSIPLKFFCIRPHLRLGLFISIGIHISQQLSGINAVIYYSSKIFTGAGFSINHAIYATIGVGLSNLVMTFVSVFLVDRLGRKTLHLAGLCGMLFFAILLSVCLICKHTYSGLIYFAMVFIFLYVASFGIGPGSIPWFIVAELFLQDARGTAMTVAVFVNWACQIVIGMGYPQLLHYIKDYSFLPFVGLLCIFIIFTIKFVPETKAKTPEEMENYLKRKVNVREFDEAPLLTNAYIGPIMVDEYDYRI